MSEIRKYVLVDKDDQERPYQFDNYREAELNARRLNMAIVAQVYEYADSELVWTPDGNDTWPPEGGTDG